ncbi:hypothetical protein DICVIV_11691 [Dictyocaulus viviparus]|uniref:Uncharacterized protein n=1 Tax=Dictyocaulus viviparus TaxID=29172 RepID=A0A0D8XJ13_DICVI|nr:hypothetical protein DICVIV_11691 [Dictyocaulus viviparus]
MELYLSEQNAACYGKSREEGEHSQNVVPRTPQLTVRKHANQCTTSKLLFSIALICNNEKNIFLHLRFLVVPTPDLHHRMISGRSVVWLRDGAMGNEEYKIKGIQILLILVPKGFDMLIYANVKHSWENP